MCFPDKYYENYKYLSNDIFVFFNIDFDMSAQQPEAIQAPCHRVFAGDELDHQLASHCGASRNGVVAGVQLLRRGGVKADLSQQLAID
jgi:hypothetical protein